MLYKSLQWIMYNYTYHIYAHAFALSPQLAHFLMFLVDLFLILRGRVFTHSFQRNQLLFSLFQLPV